jgi:hypothetical protein
MNHKNKNNHQLTISTLCEITSLKCFQIFHEATMDNILRKQYLLTGYLEYLLKKHFAPDCPDGNGESNGDNGSTVESNGSNGHTNDDARDTNGINGHTNGTNGHTNGTTNGDPKSAAGSSAVCVIPLTLDIITPSDPKQRGSQLSLRFSDNVAEVFRKIEKRAIVVRFSSIRVFWTVRHAKRIQMRIYICAPRGIRRLPLKPRNANKMFSAQPQVSGF